MNAIRAQIVIDHNNSFGPRFMHKCLEIATLKVNLQNAFHEPTELTKIVPALSSPDFSLGSEDETRKWPETKLFTAVNPITN